MQRESIECLVMAWHALTVRCSLRFGVLHGSVINYARSPLFFPIFILFYSILYKEKYK